MAAMVESVKDKGVTQAAIVRPREDGGYEIVSGHRRQMASELAGFTNPHWLNRLRSVQSNHRQPRCDCIFVVRKYQTVLYR